MPGLYDYGALLRSGQESVPDYAEQEARRQLLSLQKMQQRRLAAEAEREIAEHDSFEHDLATIMTNPNAKGYSALIAKHPKFAQQLKSSWDVMDGARQKADLQSMSEVYSAAANGKHDLAAALMQRRIDADKAAGQPPDPHDQAILDALNSGDPTQQKGALGMIGVTLSAVTGPDKFEQTLGALTKGTTPDLRNVGPGENVVGFDPQTNKATVLYESPYLKTQDGGLLLREGGGQASASGAAPPPSGPIGGFDHAVETVLSNEGGYNPHDMNGAPVNFGINQKANPEVDVKGLTRDQAKQIYHDKYWVPSGAELLAPNLQAPYFDVYIRNPKFAKAALEKSKGDPAEFMALSTAYFQGLAQKPSGARYAKAWANRDANNLAIATGGGSAPAVAGGPPAPSGYKWVVPPKRREAPSGFRWTADGNLEAIAGGPADQNEGDLDDQTTTFYAQQILAGGQMPPLGMGKQAAKARQQIMRQVAKQAGGEGLTGGDLATQIAHYKAASKALGVLETQAGTVEQNEQTALMNGQQFIDRSKELSGQTRFPIVNSATQAYLRHTGDPTIAAMDAAWNTFTTEYAKVVAGSPSGAGVLSDSARHEAQQTMRGNYTVAQKESAFKQMQADMANRMTAIHARIVKGYQDLTTNPRKAVRDFTGGNLPKGARIVGTYQGKRVIEVNGKRMVEQ